MEQGSPRGITYGVVVVVLCVAAATSAWLLGQGAPGGLRALDPAPVPLTASVSEAVVTYDSPAQLTLAFSRAADLLTNGQPGVVTALHAKPGDRLSTGSALYSADGIRVTGYVGEVVFFRTLGVGHRGEDVREAQRVLAALVPSRRVVADGVYGASTAAAARAFASSIGISQPDGTFSPTWFVRIPTSDYRVDSIDVVLGAPAPGPGTSIMSATPVPTSGAIRPLQQNLGPDGEYEFVHEGKAMAVHRDGETWTLTDVQTAADVFTSAPSDGTVLSNSTVPADSTVSLDGRVRLATPETGTGVPPASLILGGDGDSTCLAVTEAESGYSIVPVLLVGTSIDGTALVSGPLTPGDSVLVNPGEILQGRECR